MKSLGKELKEFLLRGNLVETAVALVMALAFKPVVDAFIDGIALQVVALIGGSPDSFGKKYFSLGDTPFFYGAVISAIISFVITGTVVFFIVKAYNKVRDLRGTAAEAEVAKSDDVLVLEEIRDLLRAQRNV